MGSQTFTANGTYTVPTGVTSVTVVCRGGGGGGGGSVVNGGGGGGGGAYASSVLTVVPGAAHTITVG
ncbi:MAG: phage tail protein, partial [Acidimicrobiales bacterium]